MERAALGIFCALEALGAGCTAEVDDLGLSGRDLGVAVADSGLGGAEDAQAWVECDSASGFEGTWVYSGGFAALTPNPPPDRLDRCLGVGDRQHLSEIKVLSSGAFAGRRAGAPSTEVEGCVVLGPAGAELMVVECPSCDDLSLPARFGQLQWAPTGAIRMEVRRIGTAFTSPSLPNCLACGPDVVPAPECRSMDGSELVFWYDPQLP